MDHVKRVLTGEPKYTYSLGVVDDTLGSMRYGLSALNEDDAVREVEGILLKMVGRRSTQLFITEADFDYIRRWAKNGMDTPESVSSGGSSWRLFEWSPNGYKLVRMGGRINVH